MIFDNLLKTEIEVIDCIEESLSLNKVISLTYLNQHCFNIYNSNSKYRNLLDNKFKVYLDGFGVYAVLKFLGYKNIQKFNATELHYKIFQKFSIDQTKLFIIGGNFSDKLIYTKAVEKKNNICGYHSGYFKNEEFEEIINSINKSSPEVIIIGMGVPMQEILAARISEESNAASIICVGGFLEFYFGTKKRAPKWLRRIWLEWLHRLISEPKRMWKRYIIGIPIFVFHIVKLRFTYTKPEK